MGQHPPTGWVGNRSLSLRRQRSSRPEQARISKNRRPASARLREAAADKGPLGAAKAPLCSMAVQVA